MEIRHYSAFNRMCFVDTMFCIGARHGLGFSQSRHLSAKTRKYLEYIYIQFHPCRLEAFNEQRSFFFYFGNMPVLFLQ